MPRAKSLSALRCVTTRGRRLWLPVLVSLTLSVPAYSADLWTVTQDALENDADFASARSQFDAVEAGRGIQHGALLPQISAGANAAHNRVYESQTIAGLEGPGVGGPGGPAGAGVDDNFNSAAISLEASQALFNATRWYELDVADRQIDVQTYSLAAAEQQLLLDASSAYFEILRAYDVLEAREAQERAIERQLRQARQQFDVGVIAITGVEEAQAAYDLARAERIIAQSDLQVSFEVLERLTGQRYEGIYRLVEGLSIEPPQPTERDQWVELALNHSPMLMMARARVDVSRSQVDVAQAQRLPVLEAFAHYEYADSDSDVVSGHDSASQIGLRASVPLFTGGSTSARIQQNTYLLESSQYDAEAQRRGTIQQVRSFYTRVLNDVETVEARRQAVVSNQSALNATRDGYEAGTRNIVDVLDAERNLYDAIAAHAEARYTYVLDLLSLRQQAGTLDVDTVRLVNEWLSDEARVSLGLPAGSSGDAYGEAMNIGEPPQPPQ